MQSDPAAPTVAVFVREGCHLCDAVVHELYEFRAKREPAFDVVLEDVDRSADMAARFGEFVPVLMLGDIWVCHYFFDPEALEAALAGRARPDAAPTP